MQKKVYQTNSKRGGGAGKMGEQFIEKRHFNFLLFILNQPLL